MRPARRRAPGAAVARGARPSVVYHLAALASVGRSWQDPGRTLRDNAGHDAQPARGRARGGARRPCGRRRLRRGLRAARARCRSTRARRCARRTPTRCPRPPPTCSRASTPTPTASHVIRPRAFNHAGPGQPPIFAIASFARQVAGGLEAGDDPVRVVTGNPDARRDFTDVRDVVRAYRLLAARGEPGRLQRRAPGSPRPRARAPRRAGRGRRRRDRARGRPRLVRAHEVMEVRGAPTRLHAPTGWEPEIPLTARSPTPSPGGGRRSARGGRTRARTSDPRTSVPGARREAPGGSRLGRTRRSSSAGRATLL